MAYKKEKVKVLSPAAWMVDPRAGKMAAKKVGTKGALEAAESDYRKAARWDGRMESRKVERLDKK